MSAKMGIVLNYRYFLLFIIGIRSFRNTLKNYTSIIIESKMYLMKIVQFKKKEMHNRVLSM